MAPDEQAPPRRLRDELANASFFTLRTPVLPFDEILRWSSGTTAAWASPEDLDRALQADRVVLRARLREALSRPHVKEAIFVASPDLASRLDAWDDEDGPKSRAIEAALVRYFMRMAGRATPFGLFAGCSVGRLGPDTRLAVEGRQASVRHTRLDMAYLCALVDGLERSPGVRETLKFRPNSSLYEAGGRIHYAQARLRGPVRSYHAIAVEPTDYLVATLERARAGATAASLASALAADPEVSADEASAYLDELIESQVLVSDLMPPVTGPEPIHVLIERLGKDARTASAGAILERVRNGLDDLDAGGLGADPAAYRSIADLLEPLPAKVDPKTLFQVDLIKPAPQITLGGNCLSEILGGVELLHRLWQPEGSGALERFRKAFVARYETKEVPLLEALDGDVGVGLGDPPSADAPAVLDGLTLSPKRRDLTVAWERRHDFLLRKLLESTAAGRHEIDLDESDIEALSMREGRRPLPSAFAVSAAIAARSAAAIEEGDFSVVIQFADGPPGVRFLGRFCHAHPEIGELVREHIRCEEAHTHDAVIAEVAHLPEGRVGNVLLRPVLRGHEIAYLGRSGAMAEKQILASDLRISVTGDRIVLRSEALGREVIPRLTTAHNFGAANVRLYRLLGELQRCGTAGSLAWSWGPLEGAAFLPRIRSGRVVLSRARWSLPRREMEDLVRGTDADRFRRVQQLRERLRLPRFVLLADGDNELPVDLDNVLSIEAFLNLARKREIARLIEMLPGPDQLAAHDGEGRCVHELVLHCVRKPERRIAHSVCALRRSSGHRRFPVGSEWLYLKLYCGPATADRVLREVVAPVASAAEATGATDHWFFIRYGDPDWHIRFRLHGSADRLAQEILPAIHERARALLADGNIWRIAADTYEREVERYGGDDAMLLAERLFHHDSQAALEVLDGMAGDEASLARWSLALRGAHELLDGLGLTPEARIRLLERARDGLDREFGAGKPVRIRLGDKFRKEKFRLQALVDGSAMDGALIPGLKALRVRSQRLHPWLMELRSLAERQRLSCPLDDIAASLIHMSVNRLLRSAHRAQELVLYDFLSRLYVSEVRRAGVPGVRATVSGATP
jgi:thiopeptide-type bacteriocin biosynthesis protein